MLRENSINVTQMLLEMGPGVSALILAGQEERVRGREVGHSISLQHGSIKNRSHRLLQPRKLRLCGENVAHPDI